MKRSSSAASSERTRSRLLPIDRVWVGIRSTRPDAFGGFHHPDQGYRHLQLASLITRYGRLSEPSVASPELVALDLLRSYAHDCLHFGSFREYRLQQGRVIRSRYGINWRDEAGRTYCAPDQPGSPSTRNLGIVMEGPPTGRPGPWRARWPPGSD